MAKCKCTAHLVTAPYPVTEALHAVELTSFLWHMPEGVAEHSFFRLQPSVNLHAQLQPSCSPALVPNVLPRRAGPD